MGEHFKIAREVFEEEQRALEMALPKLKENFNALVELLLHMKGKLIIAGVGKSGSVGQKISATFSSTGTPSIFINGSEALHGDLGIITRDDIVMMITNSGATIELVEMIPSLDAMGVVIVGILGNCETPLARRCKIVLDAGVEKEACPLNLAPMSSTTVSMVMGDALAAALMRARHFEPKDFALRHPGGFLGKRLLLKVKDVMHEKEDVPQVGDEATFSEVLVESTRPNLGAVCVLDEHSRLKGIITDGDIRRLLLQDPCMKTLRAKDCMTASPISIGPETSIDATLHLMEEKKIYNLPVVDPQDKLLGIVDMHSILSGKIRVQ